MASDETALQHLLALRQVAAFATAGLDELAALAETARAVAFEAGAEVAAAGAELGQLHLVLSGRIEAVPHASAAPHELRAWTPHELFGVYEALAHRPLGPRAIATEATHTLQLSAGELGDLLEDNFGVMTSMLRELARRVVAACATTGAASGSAITASATGTRPLGLIERVLVLRDHRLLAHAHLQALFMLANLSTEARWAPGSPAVCAGDDADHAIFLIDGALSGDGGKRCEPGDALGLLEMLGGLPHRATAKAIGPTRALLASTAAVFDVLEDHAALGLAMLEALAAALLDAAPQACASPPARAADR
jgi:CRP-like cAMP-binding protein